MLVDLELFVVPDDGCDSSPASLVGSSASSSDLSVPVIAGGSLAGLAMLSVVVSSILFRVTFR